MCAAVLNLPGPIIHSTLTGWSDGAGVMDALLPIRWACPETPAPAPTGPPHIGQSYFHPKNGHRIMYY